MKRQKSEITQAPASEDDMKIVYAIVDRCKAHLYGARPGLQGAALAELLSLWLAGHDPELRQSILKFHIKQVRALTLVNARALRGEPGGR